MTIFICKRTKRLKYQESRKKARTDSTAATVKLPNSIQLSLRNIASTTNLSETIVGERRDLLRTDDAAAVEKQVLVNRMQGLSTPLTEEEGSMIAERR